ncbi:MAG: hypothetical protein P8K77_03720 [Polaribacter sp.]|nr:hypothetical protein [Polaribacter sp.]
MKKLKTGLLVVMGVLSFTSCATFENEVEAPQEQLLQMYTLSRDTNGAYSINYNVADKTSATSHKNIGSKTNEIYLDKVGYREQKNYKNNFSLDDDKIKIRFVDNNTSGSTQITVEDENATFAKGANNNRFLKEYEVTGNADGTFQLDFEINEGIQSEFVYNKESSTYEIHLSKGDSTEKQFSRAIDIADDGVLKVDFVNHKYAGKGEATGPGRKPRIIIITD